MTTAAAPRWGQFTRLNVNAQYHTDGGRAGRRVIDMPPVIGRVGGGIDFAAVKVQSIHRQNLTIDAFAKAGVEVYHVGDVDAAAR